MSYQLINSDTVQETPELLALLRQVNREVNQFNYVTDINNHDSEDYWTARIATFNSGDCDDYTLGKRKRLIEAGVPFQCLFPTICRVNGDGHLVLAVRTTGNDWILDNLSNNILEAGDLDYDWISRLEPSTGNWLRI